jgi:hypothetical protein
MYIRHNIYKCVCIGNKQIRFDNKVLKRCGDEKKYVHLALQLKLVLKINNQMLNVCEWRCKMKNVNIILQMILSLHFEIVNMFITLFQNPNSISFAFQIIKFDD